MTDRCEVPECPVCRVLNRFGRDVRVVRLPDGSRVHSVRIGWSDVKSLPGVQWDAIPTGEDPCVRANEELREEWRRWLREVRGIGRWVWAGVLGLAQDAMDDGPRSRALMAVILLSSVGYVVVRVAMAAGGRP